MQTEEFDTLEYFMRLLQNPKDLTMADIEKLDLLYKRYPFCSPIAILKAKASFATEKFNQHLIQASTISNNREIIFRIINQPEKFILLKDDAQNEPSTEKLIEENVDQQLGLSETEEKTIENDIEYLDIASTINFDKEENLIATEFINIEEGENLTSENLNEQVINVETYDYRAYNDIEKNVLPSQPIELTLNKDIVEEKTINTDDQKEISNYHDDKMPYTFLWWLNKTRKEFDQNYQPYAQKKFVEKNVITPIDTLLDHQITEHIIHQGTFDEYANVEINNEAVTKEDKIIFKFITEEPQIKPLPSNKIDNENKAQKSSSDKQELVSETLAKIYVEQMLYSKALDAYKKLSLKYPEKSAYFASQIKYLELKIN